jgi:phage-related minor tail protein
MAGRIKGITIEIDGNTTQLQKSLKDVDKSLRDTQKSLKDVDKLLKLDPSNTELLRQKQDLLAKAINDTKSRLDKLKEAQRQMDANGIDKNSEQYQALQREIIACEQALEGYQKQVNALNPSIQSFGVKMGELSEKTRGLSTAASGLGVAMLGMAYKAGTSADDLLTLSRNTGISIEELQKMQYASDLVDVSMDQMTGSLTKMVKQMASGNDAFDTLGVSITDADGNMRDATDVWYESLQALSQVENGTLRDQLAMELFGKSAMDLSGIVDDGGEALRAYGQEAEDMGLILSEDSVSAAGEFNDALDKLKATAQQSFFEAGAALAESLLPMLETLVQKVSEVLTWFASLDGNTQMLILTIVGLVAAISPVAGLISGIVTIGGALAAVTAPMAATFMGIVAAVGAVIAIGTVLYQNWDSIKQAGIDLWNSVVTTWEGIKTTISNAIEGARNAVSNAIEAIKGLFNFQISWPHIPLPHFSVSGSANPLDWLKNGVPSISVDWYAKAQNQPYLFNSPSIIGVGDVPEVVVGADMFRNLASGQTINMPISVTVEGNVNDPERFADAIADRINMKILQKTGVFR